MATCDPLECFSCRRTVYDEVLVQAQSGQQQTVVTLTECLQNNHERYVNLVQIMAAQLFGEVARTAC